MYLWILLFFGLLILKFLFDDYRSSKKENKEKFASILEKLSEQYEADHESLKYYNENIPTIRMYRSDIIQTLQGIKEHEQLRDSAFFKDLSVTISDEMASIEELNHVVETSIDQIGSFSRRMAAAIEEPKL